MDSSAVERGYFITEPRQQQLERVLDGRAVAARHGTVGAVARDADGRVAAATSTGGMVGQADGRVGDSPIVGAGVYARDNVVAISSTGHGEAFICGVVAYDIAARIRYAGAGLADGGPGDHRAGARPARLHRRHHRRRRRRPHRGGAQFAGDVLRPRHRPGTYDHDMTDTSAEALPLRDEIFQRMDELTPAERKVARTLLARYPAAGLESTAALAAAAGTSKPTVLRLLDRLGFGSYPEFQQRLRGEVTRSMNESPVSRARARRAVPSDDSVFLRAVEQRAGLVARLPDTVPPAEIERAVALLAARPKHVVISGGYFSRLVARMLAMQLDQLIPNVDYADEPLGADIAKYLRAGRDSVVIVYDLRRYELAAKEVVTLAKAAAPASS